MTEGDLEAAVARLRAMAEGGDYRAQNNLGAMYKAGHGVPQSSAEAARWYRRSAEQGNAKAQCNLATLCLDGDGVPQSDAEAAAWLRRAAEQGYARAQNTLGALYMMGRGVPADAAEDPCTQPVAAQDVEDSRQPAAVECGQERADSFDSLVGRGVPEPVEVRDRPADEGRQACGADAFGPVRLLEGGQQDEPPRRGLTAQDGLIRHEDRRHPALAQGRANGM